MAVTQAQWEKNNATLIANGIAPNPIPAGGFAPSTTGSVGSTSAGTATTPKSSSSTTVTPVTQPAGNIVTTTQSVKASTPAQSTTYVPSLGGNPTNNTYTPSVPAQVPTQTPVQAPVQTQTPVVPPTPQSPQVDFAGELQKLKNDFEKQSQQQTIAIRDFVESLGKQIEFDGTNLIIDGTKVDPKQYGLQNVEGRFMGTPDQIGSMFGLAPLRGTFEGAGASVGYNAANGMIDVNGIPIGNAEQIGAVNIGGRLYINPETAQSINSRIGGTQFNNVNPQTGEVPQGDVYAEEDVAKTQYEEKIDTYEDNIDKLTQQYYELVNNPPDDNNEAIVKMLDNLKGWKGVYNDQLSSLIGQTLGAEFEYNPEEDLLLQDATKYANRQMMEALNARGILNGTQTADEMARIYKELLPQYQNQAYERFNTNLNNKFKQIDVLNKLNEQDYDRYYQYTTNAINVLESYDTKTYNSFKDNLTAIRNGISDQLEAQKTEITKRKNDVELGYKMLDEVGYVNREISLLTGLKVGVLSSKARESLQKRYFELQDSAQQLQDEITKKNLDHQYKLEEIAINKAEKQKEEMQKTKAGEVLGRLSSLSGVDAMKEIQSNIGMLSDVLGDQLMDVVKNVRTQIDKDESEAMANKRLGLSIAAQDRATAASERAAAAAERAAEKERTKPPTDAEIRQGYNQVYKTAKSLSYDDAYKYLTTNRVALSGNLGPDLYKKLFNDVMEDAINEKYKINGVELTKYEFD